MARSHLTVREVAELLSILEGTVRLWLSKRILPRINCGRAVRVPAEAVAEFIERNTIPARQDRRSQQ